MPGPRQEKRGVGVGVGLCLHQNDSRGKKKRKMSIPANHAVGKLIKTNMEVKKRKLKEDAGYAPITAEQRLAKLNHLKNPLR